MARDYVLVDTPGQLDAVARSLSGVTEAAVDVEADSLYRYRERVCLIQISVPGKDWLIDPLTLPDIKPLEVFFGDGDIEKVFHDADFDLRSLDRDFHLRVRNIFDTRWAAELAGIKPVSLAGLLDRFCGVTLQKKYQKYNWSKRPISDDAMRYAAEDTRHLLRLKSILKDQLIQLGRWDWAEAVFRRLEDIRWAPSKNARLGFRRMKFIKKCSPKQLAMLEEIWSWRDREARRRDVPLFKVLSDGVIEAIVLSDVSTRKELSACLPPALRRKRSVIDGLWAAVKRALERSPETYPDIQPSVGNNHSPHRKAMKRWRRLRNELADELGVEPHVLVGKKALEYLAAHEKELGTMADDDICDAAGLLCWQWRLIKEKGGPKTALHQTRVNP